MRVLVPRIGNIAYFSNVLTTFVIASCRRYPQRVEIRLVSVSNARVELHKHTVGKGLLCYDYGLYET